MTSASGYSGRVAVSCDAVAEGIMEGTSGMDQEKEDFIVQLKNLEYVHAGLAMAYVGEFQFLQRSNPRIIQKIREMATSSVVSAGEYEGTLRDLGMLQDDGKLKENVLHIFNASFRDESAGGPGFDRDIFWPDANSDVKLEKLAEVRRDRIDEIMKKVGLRPSDREHGGR
jgi:hypothetical protein